MAHFAELDENNVVLRILVVPDSEEHRGQDFLEKDLGLGGRWIQTSRSGSIRKRFAMVGGTYSSELDAFIPVKPYPSWVFDENELDWSSPIPKPTEPFDTSQPENCDYVWLEGEQLWHPFYIDVSRTVNEGNK